MHQLRSHLSYANVVSTMCLFLLLGGTAWAAVAITGKDVRNESLTGKDIKNGSVDGRDIRNGDVTAADILNGTINTSDVGEGSLNSGDIGDGSLLARDFKPGELPGGLQGPKGDTGATGDTGGPGPAGKDGAGGGAGTLTVRTATRPITLVCSNDFGCFGEEAVTASCEEGERATGGGAGTTETSFPAANGTSRPEPTAGTPTGWTVDMQSRGESSPDESAPVYVICAS